LVALDGASGAPAWAKSFGGNGPDHGLGVGVADDGSIAASGSFTTSIDFGDGAHTSASPDGAAFVTKVGRDGATQWSRAWDGLVVGSNALAMSGAGAVAFTGFAG